MNKEIEAKFLSINKDACRADLEMAGFVCERAEFLMRRYTFMLSELNPNPNKWARVRDQGDKVTMTFKHVHSYEDIEGTEEIDFEVSSFEQAVKFMQGLGFNHWAYQESKREIWRKGDVEVTLNEWPALPAFIEIEASNADAVKAASAELGFDYTKAVFGGVGALYGMQTSISAADISNVRELTFAKANNLVVERREANV